MTNANLLFPIEDWEDSFFRSKFGLAHQIAGSPEAVLCARPSQQKHHDYDPTERHEENMHLYVKRSAALHFAMMAVWPPQTIHDAECLVMLDSLSSDLVSGRPLLLENLVSRLECQRVAIVQCPALDDRDCSALPWQQIEIGLWQVPRPWWKREKSRSHTDSLIHSSHRLRPILVTLIVKFCNAMR